MLHPIDLTFERHFPARLATVWACLTEPSLLARWFFPVDFEARIGHRFRIEGPAVPGWRGWTLVEVTELEAPRHMVWRFDCVDEAPPSSVIFSLSGTDGDVRLRLRHDGRVPMLTRRLLDEGWTLYLAQLAQAAREAPRLRSV